MDTKPEALRLANALESGYVFDKSAAKMLNQAAAELRRLHEETEWFKSRLESIYKIIKEQA